VPDDGAVATTRNAPMKHRAFPLTSLQRAMLAASRRSPGAGMYIVQDVCKTPENIDFQALRHAWSKVSLLHEALRTSFEITGTSFEQRVDDEVDHSWQELDWRAMDSAAARRDLDALLERDRLQGFDPGSGPPMRFRVIRMPEGISAIAWTVHHAAIDGRSNLIVWSDLFRAYEAVLAGHAVQLAPAAPFRDYVEFVGQLDSKRAVEYWRGHLAGLSQASGLLVDRLRPGAGTRANIDSGKITVELSDFATAAVRAFAAGLGLTVNSLVQAAWALLLSRCSGNRDVVFGVTRACRGPHVPESDRMVGTLINTLPFRVDVDPDATVSGWLKGVRSQAVEMRPHEHTPLDTVWQATGESDARPFETLVLYEHETVPATFRSLGEGWRLRSMQRAQSTDLRLTLSVYGNPRITLDLVYDKTLFTSATIESLGACLEAILEGFVAGAEVRVSQLGLLPRVEHERLIHGVNRTQKDFPQTACAHHLVQSQARSSPDRIALEQGGRVITYAELDRRSASEARALQAIGAGRGDIIAVLVPRSPETVIAILAALKAGCVFAILDPDQPPERLSGMLEDAAPAVVLVSPGDRVGGLAQQRVLCLGETSPVASDLIETVTADDPAYVVYTSGSTGKPKGVVVSHRALVNHTLAAGEVFGITPLDRRLQFASMTSDVFIAEVFNYLAQGATLVFPAGGTPASLSEFTRTLELNRITIAGLPAKWFEQWVEHLKAGGSDPPQSLRAVIFGMEATSPGAAIEWKKLAPSIRLFNAYGPTETAMTATTYEVGHVEREKKLYLPIGTPVANMRAYVLDSARHPVPCGIAGELYLSGASVALRYHGLPELTAERFVPDPFQPEGRMYRTGDIAFRSPDGNLVLLGRSDRQVKIRGFRVELEEIEAALSGHPAVLRCAVTVDAGTRHPMLAAYIVAKHTPSVRDLRSHLGQVLPAHMIPSAFVVVPALPETQTGKTDHRSLPRLENCTLLQDSPGMAPRTPTETLLAALWTEVLGTRGFGVRDDFFEVGGDSLTAAILVRLVRDRLGRDLPMAALFPEATIARMALVLEGSREAASEGCSAVVLRETGSRVPMFCVSWDHDDPYCFRHLCSAMGADQPFYAVPNPLTIAEQTPRVEDLASQVRGAIAAIRSRGPYVLGGFCFGGVLAYETARQMVEGGEEVHLVALFDTPAPGFPKVGTRGYWRRAFELGYQAIRGSESVRGTDVKKHVRMLGERATQRARGLIGRSSALAGAGAALPSAERLGFLMRHCASAYSLRPLNVPTVQFLAQDEPVRTRVLEDPRLSWDEVCPAHRVYQVPGGHRGVLAPTGAEEIAAILRELLHSDRGRLVPISDASPQYR
jgi:amino acid adenylation domain-containing protein